MKKVRFWYYGNGISRVRLTLEAGGHLNWCQSYPTDEGFRYESWSMNYDGETVWIDVATGGSDCDGPIDHFTGMSFVVPLIRDRAGALVRMTSISIDGQPEWVVNGRETIDTFAQAAGY